MFKIAPPSASVKAPRRRHQTVYRIRNGPADEAGLKQRGSLTFGLPPQALWGWYHQGPTKCGSQDTYSDLASQTAWMIRLLYPLPLRQTTETARPYP